MVTIDQASHRLDAPPQPRYHGLTLPKLRLGRVKLVAIGEKCPFPFDISLPAPRSGNSRERSQERAMKAASCGSFVP